jgi:hypothetical protein
MLNIQHVGSQRIFVRLKNASNSRDSLATMAIHLHVKVMHIFALEYGLGFYNQLNALPWAV